MRNSWWIWRYVIAGLTMLLVAGCSYVTPDTSSVGLSYIGGTQENKSFDMCVPPGGNEREDSGGKTYYYPTGLITWDFSNRPGAESPPLAVSTSNNQEVLQSGTINLRLKTSCDQFTDPPEQGGREWKGGILQKWHENIGQRNAAFFTSDSSVIPAGWIAALSKFVGAPAERAMDQAGGERTWQDLYSDTATQKLFVDKVTEQLPKRMESSTGGIMYFEIVSVELDKPTVPEQLRLEMVATEASLLSQKRANQDLAFATSFPGGQAGYQAFKRQEAETKCLNEGRCTIVPAGVPVSMPSGS